MNVKILPLYLVLIALFPALCMGEEYELHSWNMREVSPMEVTEATGPESVDIYYVRSAPLSTTDLPMKIYDYRDSAIVSDHGLLSTFLKFGGDTVGLVSVQNRTLRLTPVMDCASTFVRSLSHPLRMEFDAYAERPGKDSLQISMEVGVVPKGRCTLVIDNDTLASLSVVDRYISTYMPDSISGGVVWRRETRDLYGNERIFPVAREITDYFSVGEDTVASPTVTLLAAQETLEDMVRGDPEIRRAPGAPIGGNILLDVEIVSADELLVSFATPEPESGVELSVYDILGRLLAAPRKADASPALSQMRVSLGSPMPGVFFVSLVSVSGTETVKIMQ